MIIGFDANRAFQNNSGLGNYSRMLICGLAQEYKDLRAFLYAPSMSGYYKTYFTSYANISTHQPSGFDRFFPGLWKGFGVSMHLNEDKVQLYHGLSNELPHRIPKKIKTVVTMHDLIAWLHPEYYRYFDREIGKAKQKHSCRQADLVIAVSEQTKRDLIEVMHLPAEKIKVLYQTCDPIFWQPVPAEDKADIRQLYHLPEKYFVCVGGIEERKNQIVAVMALKEMPKEYHLVIVGRPSTKYYSDLLKTINGENLNDRVHVISKADFEDFPGLYANAIASVYVSRFEGFPIPIVESMCCDTPVVASNCSSMPEAGGEAALYCNPDDPHDIAQKMLQVADNASLREQLVDKGRTQREKFTQTAIVSQLYHIYEELIGPEASADED